MSSTMISNKDAGTSLPTTITPPPTTTRQQSSSSTTTTSSSSWTVPQKQQQRLKQRVMTMFLLVVVATIRLMMLGMPNGGSQQIKMLLAASQGRTEQKVAAATITTTTTNDHEKKARAIPAAKITSPAATLLSPATAPLSTTNDMNGTSSTRPSTHPNQQPSHSESSKCHPDGSLDKNVTAPKMLYLDKMQIRLLHIGKGGGASIRGRFKHIWRAYLEQCHAFPCNFTRDHFDASDPHNTKIINIRDPIDRFVSSFYWAILRVCDPEIKQSCKVKDPYEQRILHEKYKQNVNELAERLCEEKTSNDTTAGGGNEDDSITLADAKNDTTFIRHMKRSIGDWLHGTNWWTNESRESFFPIILEPNYDFEMQIDDAARWVQFNRTGIDENATAFASRQAFVDVRNWRNCKQKKRQQQKLLASSQQQKLHRHSSKRLPSTVPLSKRGAKCLAQFYQDDYEIIRKMTTTPGWCKNDECQRALNSILKRRQHLLAEE